MSDENTRPLTVYLLHFDQLVAGKRHYLGICHTERAWKRWDEHRRCSGAKLTARAASAGIGFTVATTWPDASFELERRLKQRGHAEKLCPICRGELDLDSTRLHYDAKPLPLFDRTDDAVRFPPGPAQSGPSPP